MSEPMSPESGHPQAYTDFLFRTQSWQFGRQQLNIPVSGFSGGILAQAYGFADLEAFCDDLPEAASVIDVAAGVSTLGSMSVGSGLMCDGSVPIFSMNRTKFTTG